MTVKVLMTWDIDGERDQAYFEFVIGEFIPGAQRLGLQIAEAWATIYGSYKVQARWVNQQCAVSGFGKASATTTVKKPTSESSS